MPVVVRAASLVLAACLTAGCASAPTAFPPEPRIGSVFNSYVEPHGAGPFPAVVLLHTCGGLTGHTSGWAHRLAAQGYASVVVDSFRPRGGARCRPPYWPATLDDVAADAQGALDYLRGRAGVDSNRIAVVGFSYGASAALRLASPRYHGGKHRFGAAVAWYPICVQYPGGAPERGNNLYGDVDTPTLILMGAADDDTPGVVTNCAKLVEQMRKAGRPIDMIEYPGAGHVFDAGGGDAAAKATDDMLAFLRRHLGAAR